MPPIAKPALNRGYPKTIVLVFAELVLFWGSGTLHGKPVSDGEAVQVKEQVFVPVLWGIPDTLKTAIPKTGLFPVLPLLQPI